jgi:hypothetical protein
MSAADSRDRQAPHPDPLPASGAREDGSYTFAPRQRGDGGPE